MAANGLLFPFDLNQVFSAVNMSTLNFTAIIERDGDAYTALCPELDVASQGKTVEEATANLKEAVELFLESADDEEVQNRLAGEIYVTRFEATHG